jgi:hypothetical protein
VSTQPTSETLQDEPAPRDAAPRVERWRAPVAVRAKALVSGACAVTILVTFFPAWLGIPFAVLFGLDQLGVAVLGIAVLVDPVAGRVVVRRGLLARRVRLTDITAVLVEHGKLSLARAKGSEFSITMWRIGLLDTLLRVPVVAGDAGHAIAKAVALAQSAADPATVPASPEAAEPGAAGTGAGGRTPRRTRAKLAIAVLCGGGAVEIAAALLVRVHWHNPAMTVLGVVIAVALGVTGLATLLFGIWVGLTGREPSRTWTVR